MNFVKKFKIPQLIIYSIVVYYISISSMYSFAFLLGIVAIGGGTTEQFELIILAIPYATMLLIAIFTSKKFKLSLPILLRGLF